MLTVYGYMPAWGVQDISPYVTKLANYLTFSSIQYELKPQDLTKLDEDAPYGKLPRVVDDDGTKVADSNSIIQYLKKTRGDKLDEGLSKSQRAQMLAWNRLIEEHLYYAGILQPRWKQDDGFAQYVPILVQGAEVTPPLQEFLNAFRDRIVANFNGQGMGRRDVDTVLEFYKADIDALSDFMADKPYFFDDKIRSIDASVYAILRHCTDQVQKWKGSGYIETKPNLVSYMERIRKEYKV